jgi:hypothetical protein
MPVSPRGLSPAIAVMLSVPMPSMVASMISPGHRARERQEECAHCDGESHLCPLLFVSGADGSCPKFLIAIQGVLSCQAGPLVQQKTKMGPVSRRLASKLFWSGNIFAPVQT